MAGSILGWKLDGFDRERLLGRFRPRYAETVADHVTLGRAGTAPEPRPAEAEIVGRADDGEGVEALVVRIDGTTDLPDGSTYHITWSPGEGRKTQESNAVLRARGWTPLAEPIPIRLHPSAWTG
ncbi:MAG TPA: hypothetical protein VF031_06555 [Alphaproteobacteria bacterium]